MDFGHVLLELLIVVVAARLAAEVAERLRQPAVLLEIGLGIVIGPSVLGLAGKAEGLELLGELGVILLLFEVGRQMDLKELARVGGASLMVALIGIVVPMGLGFFAMRAAGIEGNAAIFIAAGITATSVGITARVFGDLRALAMPEARTVLGAAVADDVIGLLILTVVVRVVGGGSLDAAELGGLIAGAIGFVVVATLVGAWLAPRLLDAISARSRADGTVMALGLALALGAARLASAVQLAPIVGSFVAGLAVGRSEVADDLHRRLTPLGHLLIPIFFLQIGIHTEVEVFADGEVLWLAGILCIVAVFGKLVAGLGATRGAGNRMIIGIGMVPRGEVGLIFASLGLSRGVLDARTYAVLLLVVLVTTIVTPPWLRKRIERARRAASGAHAARIEPPGGWLAFEDGTVELAAEPPPVLAGSIGLRAAVACAERQPGELLLEWISSAPPDPIPWDSTMRRELFVLLHEGNERSWRFMDVTGLLGRLMPSLGAELRRRPRDPFDLDPMGALRWNALEDLKDRVQHDTAAAAVWQRLQRTELVLLAALLRSVLEHARKPAEVARSFAAGIALDHEDVDTVTFFVGERHLFAAAAARADTMSEENVLDLAAFLQTRERADGLYLLALAENSMERWERERLDALHALAVEALAHPDLTGGSARDLAEHRVAGVAREIPHMNEREVRQHLWAAPRRYLLAQDPSTIVRHLKMIETKLGRFEARVEAEPEGHEEWKVHVAVADAAGVLAAIAGAFAEHRVSVREANIATWRSGVAIDVFRVYAPYGISWEDVRRSIEANLAHKQPRDVAIPIEGVITVDNNASPWYTIVELQARDRAGLLHRVTTAFSIAGVEIHQANVTTREDIAVDTFWVTNRDGSKLSGSEENALRAVLAGKGSRRWRRVPARA